MSLTSVGDEEDPFERYMHSLVKARSRLYEGKHSRVRGVSSTTRGYLAVGKSLQNKVCFSSLVFSKACISSPKSDRVVASAVPPSKLVRLARDVLFLAHQSSGDFSDFSGAFR